LLHVEGGLTISDVNAVLPDPGTIRFNQVKLDFEGWNGQHWLSLTRLREAGAGVVDLDNNLYPSIKLGTQEWMTENLRTTK
jgi:hypothetical protein